MFLQECFHCKLQCLHKHVFIFYSIHTQAMMISTDGVGMHRKSSKTFWPIAGVLANLPAEVRCLHRLIHCWALLPGDNTKNLQLYMTPLVEELVRLQRGVHLSDEMETPIRAELLFTTGDYPAHCKMTLKNQKSLIGKTLSRYIHIRCH